jgi:deoxyribodipyrimidine photo-lyase
VIGLTEAEQETARQAGVVELPTAKDLGFNWENDLVLAPGEAAAQARLEEFCDYAITEYKEQRNFLLITAHLN